MTRSKLIAAALLAANLVSPNVGTFGASMVSLTLLAKVRQEILRSEKVQSRADRQLAYFNNLHNCVHKP